MGVGGKEDNMGVKFIRNTLLCRVEVKYKCDNWMSLNPFCIYVRQIVFEFTFEDNSMAQILQSRLYNFNPGLNLDSLVFYNTDQSDLVQD